MYCYSGYTCTNIGNIRDCCAGNDCKTSSFSSVCLDYTDPACSSYSPGTRCWYVFCFYISSITCYRKFEY